MISQLTTCCWPADRLPVSKTCRHVTEIPMPETDFRSRFQRIRRVDERFQYFCFGRYCPCCTAHVSNFIPFGVHPRAEARCPRCGSLERHRLVAAYINQRTDFHDGRRKRLLHIAPELNMAHFFRKADFIEYLSADLTMDRAMVKMDITNIQYPDDSFDIIYCSHVLEHIQDDRLAMRELCRVLKPEGWAILMVPILAERTFEDAAVTSPEERERLYGQRDHVRKYGRDYEDRLVESGFSVTVEPFAKQLEGRAVRRMGLDRAMDVYFCRKTKGIPSSG